MIIRRLLFALLVSGLALAAPAAGSEHAVLLAEVTGPITLVVADYLADAVQEADEGGYAALIVAIDTPGGLDISMREIVQSFLNADVPVIAYVSPAGARAASAGTFITMAAHVAAMAPATSIGAATPVDLQGGEISDKVINDAAAFAVTVAERTGRNSEFAEAAVREGTSVTSREAVERNVVDLVADNLDQLLLEVDGMSVDLANGATVTLDTADAAVERYELGTFRSILGRLADPNLAVIFLSLGTLAVVYEAANPGMGFAGIAGVILLILAFFSLSVLPVQGAGIALLLLAVALFVAELFVPGVGVMAAGGTIALILGGLFLFEGSVSVSPVVLVPSGLILGAGSALAGRAAVRARLRPPTTGPEALLGRMVEVRSEDGTVGRAYLDGAWWEVRSRSGRLSDGAQMRVVGLDGLRLLVDEERAEEIRDEL